VTALRQGCGIVLLQEADHALAHDTPQVKRGRGRIRAHPTPQLQGGSEETSVRASPPSDEREKLFIAKKYAGGTVCPAIRKT